MLEACKSGDEELGMNKVANKVIRRVNDPIKIEKHRDIRKGSLVSRGRFNKKCPGVGPGTLVSLIMSHPAALLQFLVWVAPYFTLLRPV